MSDSTKKTKRKIFLVILGSLFFVIFLWMLFWYSVIVPFVHEVRCKGNLTDIAIDIAVDESFLYIRDIPYFKDELVLSNGFDRKMLICSACKKPYIYSPVASSGERIRVELPERSMHFVMWCPEPCRKRRAFLFSPGIARVNGDDQVSWYYQKLAIDLKDDEELKKENEYRLSRGIKPLKK